MGQERKKLRSGYTTGTCASAAAKAAAVFLLRKIRGQMPKEDAGEAIPVCVGLPGGGSHRFFPVLWSPDQQGEGLEGYFGLQKDSGDDPDVTNRAWIYAAVVPVSREELARLCREGKGYVLSEYPKLYINGGPGIGIAAKGGLSCPVGHYAINPVPRQMIAGEVWEVCEEFGYDGCLEVRVAIPEGIRLAEQTFNPQLGIEGGISILGTTGIVEPMSEAALVETIRLDIRTRVFEGQRFLLMTPGNYGEAYLWQRFGIPVGEAVKCSNFLGASMELLAEEGVSRILFVGHIGKLVKAAGGISNTHSRYGDHRMEILEQLTRACGEKNEKFLARIRQSNTTDEAVAYLQQQGLGGPVLELAAKRVQKELEDWSGGKVRAEVITFSTANQVYGETAGAKDFREDWIRGNRR